MPPLNSIMRRPNTLPAFTPGEYTSAHALLASQVATMMGRKFEEGDWTAVYCAAKGIPNRGWSNLNLDVIYECLGVEQKMLCTESKKSIKEYCGTTLMHPAATRSIRIPSSDEDPTQIARDVLMQYAELLEERTRFVAQNCSNGAPDMRVGWLLWQVALREFLYFEQEVIAPDPNDYWAEWKESGGGSRKKSKNLWVYEAETGKKRYSITTSAGAKIQPYFDVPPPNDPNLYYFLVQGEIVDGGLIRIWVTRTTALLLKQILGSLERDVISQAILKTAVAFQENEPTLRDKKTADLELAEPILITQAAYEALTKAFEGISDEHMIQLFLRHLMN